MTERLLMKMFILLALYYRKDVKFPEELATSEASRRDKQSKKHFLTEVILFTGCWNESWLYNSFNHNFSPKSGDNLLFRLAIGSGTGGVHTTTGLRQLETRENEI